MEFDHRSQQAKSDGAAATCSALAPGKLTLTDQLAQQPVQLREAVGGSRGDAGGSAPSTTDLSPRPTLQMLFGVQRAGQSAQPEDPAHVHATAAHGTATAATKLPFADVIQRSFGQHDISGIQAHIGGRAAVTAHEMGARAYATGDHVVLGDDGTDLHTVAHEAAHVVQQRAGVMLKDSVGQTGDVYERHADAVADTVVAGRSASALLDEMAPAGRGSAAPQAIQRQSPAPASGADADQAAISKADSARQAALSKAISDVTALLSKRLDDDASGAPELTADNQRVVDAFDKWMLTSGVSQSFWQVVTTVLGYMKRNASMSTTYNIDKTDMTCFAHVDTSGDPSKGITLCTFFNAGEMCQREVITHEYFHFIVGLQHFYAASSTAEAIQCPHHLAELVFEIGTGCTGGCVAGGGTCH